nr:ATP-binding cassette domain-containing protein [uncultured Actinotalea sp.]
MTNGDVPGVVLDRVTKVYRDTTALQDVSFEARPGRVLGLLGRNGAGKTTALRITLGLTSPTAGSATVLGRPYAQLPDGPRRVGSTFDGDGQPPGVTGAKALALWATMLDLPRARVGEVVDLVGLRGAERKAVSAYSTGMRQRLDLAVALLADPEVVVLDEPANGLDPDGIRWLRDLLRRLAAEGRTVIVSSHLLAEVEQTVQDVVVLQSTVRYSGPLEDLTGGRRRLEEAFFDLVDAPVAGGVR